MLLDVTFFASKCGIKTPRCIFLIGADAKRPETHVDLTRLLTQDVRTHTMAA